MKVKTNKETKETNKETKKMVGEICPKMKLNTLLQLGTVE